MSSTEVGFDSRFEGGWDVVAPLSDFDRLRDIGLKTVSNTVKMVGGAVAVIAAVSGAPDKAHAADMVFNGSQDLEPIAQDIARGGYRGLVLEAPDGTHELVLEDGTPQTAELMQLVGTSGASATFVISEHAECIGVTDLREGDTSVRTLDIGSRLVEVTPPNPAREEAGGIVVYVRREGQDDIRVDIPYDAATADRLLDPELMAGEDFGLDARLRMNSAGRRTAGAEARGVIDTVVREARGAGNADLSLEEGDTPLEVARKQRDSEAACDVLQSYLRHTEAQTVVAQVAEQISERELAAVRTRGVQLRTQVAELDRQIAGFDAREAAHRREIRAYTRRQLVAEYGEARADEIMRGLP